MVQRRMHNLWPAKHGLRIGRWAAAGLLVCAAAWQFAPAQEPVRLPPTGFRPASEVGEVDPRAVAAPAPPIVADPNVSLEAKLHERGDLVLTDTTLRQALFTISQSWQINLVVGEDVSGKVNGVFKNAPLHEILHSILYANGYGYRIVGQGLVVMRLETLGDSNPLFRTEAIVLQSIKPDDILEGASLLRSPQGKITAIPAARTLMVIDLPERIEVIRQFVEQVDRGAGGDGGGPVLSLGVKQFSPQYVKSAILKEALDAVISKEGKVVTIEEENRVVVVDYPPNLQLAEQVVRQVDVPRPQVRITALIYDVSLDDVERLGLNWHHAVKSRGLDVEGNPQQIWGGDTMLLAPAASGLPSAAMTLQSLSRNFDVRATINALCQSTDSLLLADPSVTVVDREPATIQITTEIPYQQLTQTQQGGNIGTTAFRDAGVSLKVTPFIADDNTVQMEVTPTFSRLASFTPGTNPQPIIDKREATTTVRVHNQHWLVIGGLRQRTAIKDDRAIPKASSIKYLGKLFQAYDYNFRESELIVFLMPEIVMPDYPGREREQMVLPQAVSMLEEMPVAPHILGRDEVGCPNCGKMSCRGCGHLPRLGERTVRERVISTHPAPTPAAPSPSRPSTVDPSRPQPARGQLPRSDEPQASIEKSARRLPETSSARAVEPPRDLELAPPQITLPPPSTAPTAVADPRDARPATSSAQGVLRRLPPVVSEPSPAPPARNTERAEARPVEPTVVRPSMIPPPPLADSPASVASTSPAPRSASRGVSKATPSQKPSQGRSGVKSAAAPPKSTDTKEGAKSSWLPSWWK